MTKRRQTRTPKRKDARHGKARAQVVYVPAHLILNPVSPEILAANGAPPLPQTVAEAKERFSAHLARVGLDDPALARKFREASDATEVRVGFFEGSPCYSKPLIAHDIRLRAITEVAKLKGHYPTLDSREEQRGGGPVMNVQINVVHPVGAPGGTGHVLSGVQIKARERNGS